MGRPKVAKFTSLSQTSSSVVCQAAKAKSTATGIRYDANMQRWVKDDRVGEMDEVVVQPMTGAAYTIWPVCHASLTSKGLKGVDAEKASEMQNKGWTIIDVRLEAEYMREHAKDAICIPMFRVVQGNETWDKIKRAVMSGLFMTPTERDPNYAQTVIKTLGKKGQKVMLMCSIGGTLKTGVNLRPDKYPNGIQDPDRDFGRESRCLKAAYELMEGGWNSSNLVFIEGGLSQWRFDGYPTQKS